jgi:iron-sulfur cluster assembly protein/iron-sulfur cluster insertion protein
MTAPEATRRVDIPLAPTSAPTQGVTLTSAAAAKVKELIEAEGDTEMALRLGVKRSGCSGYAYDMFFDSVIDPSDIVNETDGVRVVVDASSVTMVDGAVVDFKDAGLGGSGFAIENPNVTGTCGCGKSFS